MTHYYAQIDATGRVIAVSQLAAPVAAPDMIAIAAYDASLTGRQYDAQTGQFADPPPPDPAPAPAWQWLIDIGPFVDRLGAKRFAIEQSTDPFVASFRHDVDTRRKWIDLHDPRVAGALLYCAGQPLAGVGTIAAPILTEAEVTAVLTTPVAPDENLALRKLYFSEGV